MTKFTDHINTKVVQYKQSGFMMHMMAQQALIKAGHDHRILELTDEQITIIDAELDRRLGGNAEGLQRVAIVTSPEHLKGQLVELVNSPADGVWNTVLPSGESIVIHSDNLEFGASARKKEHHVRDSTAHRNRVRLQSRLP